MVWPGGVRPHAAAAPAAVTAAARRKFRRSKISRIASKPPKDGHRRARGAPITSDVPRGTLVYHKSGKACG
ncbi:hypothetical protein Skr01_15230 [Sphaerisporangium krabiense]|nr:hypothetical protein Skr01_15230 [Sphaerisporangium krabiense]